MSLKISVERSNGGDDKDEGPEWYVAIGSDGIISLRRAEAFNNIHETIFLRTPAQIEMFIHDLRFVASGTRATAVISTTTAGIVPTCGDCVHWRNFDGFTPLTQDGIEWRPCDVPNRMMTPGEPVYPDLRPPNVWTQTHFGCVLFCPHDRSAP